MYCHLCRVWWSLPSVKEWPEMTIQMSLTSLWVPQSVVQTNRGKVHWYSVSIVRNRKGTPVKTMISEPKIVVVTGNRAVFQKESYDKS